MLSRKVQDQNKSKSITLNKESKWIKGIPMVSMCVVQIGFIQQRQEAWICSSHVVLLRSSPVPQLQASVSPHEDEGKTVIGHVILWGQELITVGRLESAQSHYSLPPSGWLEIRHWAHKVAFLIYVLSSQIVSALFLPSETVFNCSFS